VTDLRTTLQKLLPLTGVALVGLAIAIVHHEISVYHLQDIKNDLFSLPIPVLARFGLIGERKFEPGHIAIL
jgi:hypothetical protein